MEAENRRLYKLLTTDLRFIQHAASWQALSQIISHLIVAIPSEEGMINLFLKMEENELHRRKDYTMKGLE